MSELTKDVAHDLVKFVDNSVLNNLELRHLLKVMDKSGDKFSIQSDTVICGDRLGGRAPKQC